MALTNDYVMPRLDGLPYLDKPIVYFAAEAEAMEVLGPTELAARLPAFLFTLATAAFIFWFARRLWGAEQALIAAIVALATPLTVAFSRTVIFDSALAFFVTVATGCLYLVVECGGDAAAVQSGRMATALQILAWAAMGLGVITKGPVAIALPLLVAIPYAIWRRRFRALWSLGGLVVFVAVIAPWVWAVSRAVPDFLEYVVVTETAQRLATNALKRTGPPWYFIPYLIGGAIPWSVMLLARPRAVWRRDPTHVFLLLWILVPLLFFSLSQSKRPQYILPLMPAVALLVARTWPAGRRAAAVALIILGVVLLLVPARLRTEYADAARSAAIALGIASIAGGALALAPRRDLALIGLTLPVIAIPAVMNPVMNAIAERRSTRSLVAQLRPHIDERTEVVGVETYSGSMSFYLRRPIVLVTPDGEELTSNYITRHYSRFAGTPTLKPPSWLDAALNDRSTRRVFMVRPNDAPHQAQLRRHGFRPLAVSARYAAYAPSTMP